MRSSLLTYPFLALTICAIITACSNSGHLTRRYKEISYTQITDEAELKKMVQVNGFVFEPDDPAPKLPKSLFDLSPQGQKELIRAVASKEIKSADLLEKLASPLSAKKEEASIIVDHTKFTKRLVFSIIDLSTHPADRITKASIALEVSDSLKVLSFDKIVTKYESVDVGKLDFSNTTNLGISANAGAGADAGDTSTTTASIPASAGFGYGINVNASNSRVFSEEVALKQRYVSLTGYVTPKSLNLYEESVSGIDLTGNIITIVTFKYTGHEAVRATYSFSNLSKKDEPVKADLIKVSEVYQLYPDMSNDISVKYTYGATIRQVLKGDKTPSESDDEVSMNTGSTTCDQTILLIPKGQLVPKFWIIIANKRSLFIKSPLANEGGELFFSSLEDAQAFVVWLKKLADDFNGGNLASGQYRLYLDDGSSLNKTFIDNCQVMVIEP